jgi:phosphoenolpyruvate carboxylase
MKAYAALVEDPAVRDRIFALIESEWHLTREMLDTLRGIRISSRRPRLAKTLALRAEALRTLHHQQIALLNQWRALLKSGDPA